MLEFLGGMAVMLIIAYFVADSEKIEYIIIKKSLLQRLAKHLTDKDLIDEVRIVFEEEDNRIFKQGE